MFCVTLTGFPGVIQGPPVVSILVEDHWTEIAETVSRAQFSPARIAAGLEVGPVPPRSYRHQFSSPLLGRSDTITDCSSAEEGT